MKKLSYKDENGNKQPIGIFNVTPVVVSQETGQSETEVMSQKAVTDELEKMQEDTSERISEINDKIDNIVDNDTIYDDTEIKRRLTELENRPDNDTIYDDTELRNRIDDLENKPDNDIEIKERLDTIEDILFDEPAGDVGDAVLVNNDTLEKIAVKIDELEQYKDGYTPIGVIVIPASHDVYGTGEAGVMALLSASLTTPDEGQTSNVKIKWGQYSVDTELPNLGMFAHLGFMNGAIRDNVVGTVSQGYIPIMKDRMFKGKECPTDPGTWYYNTTSSTHGYIPSPYLIDGSRNPLYYKTDSPSSTKNALSDFNGKSNTELLISLATAQEDWKTAESIDDQNGGGYSPAACACWRFHTIGTSQGDWYFPAFGELGYIAVRYDMINTTLSEISRIFGVPVCQLGTDYFWSSSQSSSTSARRVAFGSGLMDGLAKSSSFYVCPFTRLKFISSPPRPKNRLDDTIERVDNIEETYAKKSDLTEAGVKVTEDDFQVQEMVIDESDISIDIYTKQQIDEKFDSMLKTWIGTYAEYEAIEEKDDNTYYFIIDEQNEI